MSDHPHSSAVEADSEQQNKSIFASPTPMNTSFPHAHDEAQLSEEGPASSTAKSPPLAAPSASTTPMSAPTPLDPPSAPTSGSVISSTAVSRGSSFRSNGPPSSSASTTRIRKGLLSRAGSEAEDRIQRAASASASALHAPMTTDDDEDELMISDSGPMPRRFASQNRGSSSAATSSRQSSHSSVSPNAWGSSVLSATSQRTSADPRRYPHSSSSSIASGNRSGSGDASEGASGVGGVSLGRAMSVSSVSSVNSTSSLEAVPFRQAPLGNVRMGFGASSPRAVGRNAHPDPYTSFASSTQTRAEQPESVSQDGRHPLEASRVTIDQNSQGGLNGNLSPIPPSNNNTSGADNSLGSSAPASDRHKGIPKPASDAWMYRVGPGMRTNKPRIPSATPQESTDVPMEDSLASSSPAKRSREVLRQKFVKGAGRLGIKTGLGPSPSDLFAAYNPLDSSEDEMSMVPAMRTPLPRNSSYFTSTPHSAGSVVGTPLYPSLTPVPADFRTSSVTNAPLFVPKYAEELHPARPSPASVPHDARLASTVASSQAPSLPPLGLVSGGPSISCDLSPFLTGDGPGNGIGISYPRRRSSATQRPGYMRAESSNDALDRTASPGLAVMDSSAVAAPPAEPALYTLSTSASSAPRAAQVGHSLASSASAQSSPQPTPAELVRMEAQAGIASLPDSPSEPSPVPANYSPLTGDETITSRRACDTSQSRLRRPGSGTGSEASLSIATTSAGPSRRPESLQRQRMWSTAKRPAILRARTSENSISKGRRSHSLDRQAPSPSSQSPIESPSLDAATDRPGTHSKNSSSSTALGTELGARGTPHVAVIPEDDDGGNGSVSEPNSVGVSDSPNQPHSRPSSGVHDDQHMVVSPPNGGMSPYTISTVPGPRSVSPASQLARSPDTIRVGSARITHSIYGRSPASISNLRSPRLQPSPASITSQRPNTPSPRVSSARGPNDFHFGETLGEGSYSTVLEAWDLLSGPSPKEPGVVDPNATSAAAAMVGSDSVRKRRRKIDLTGRKAYAIKVLDKVHILKQGKQKYVSIEKEALSRMIRHPGVVTLFWTFQDRESLYFVLELASNGELLNYIRKYGSFDAESARYYAAQLADTIDAMHRAGVVHRDIKPENILLDANHRIKITDFGSAKIVHGGGEAESQSAAASDQSSSSHTPHSTQHSRAASFVGTAEYVSPELLVEKAQPAGKPADWWAFGCVLFQMLAGRPPFKGVNEYQTLQKVKNRDFAFPEGFPKDAQDLIDRVLTLDPMQRPSAPEIKSHSFFASIDFDNLWQADAPEIKTGLVKPLPVPQKRETFESSDFSFDEGFASSEESQAYNGDTQSIVNQTREGPEESSLSLDAMPSIRPDDADDSDLSEASSGIRQDSGESRLATRQSGPQRSAVGSKFMTNATGANGMDERDQISSAQLGDSAAPGQKFSTMSIDEAKPMVVTLSHIGPNSMSETAERAMRPPLRSTLTSRQSASPSLGSSARNQQSTFARSGASSHPAAVIAGGVQQSWSALLLPKELMLYSLPVAQKKTGAGKMFTKRRQLVLTDFPRLLCVKETAAALKVKSEVILAIPATRLGETAVAAHDQPPTDAANANTASSKGSDFKKISGRQASAHSDGEAEQNETMTANAGSSQQAIPNLLTSLEYRGGKAFTIRIANGRSFVYETLSGDASALIRCIQEARTLTT